MRIKITLGNLVVFGRLNPSPAARQIAAALPIDAVANVWGEEVYFEIPVSAALEETAQQVVDPGTICFWTHGSALALPFGKTPMSTGNECHLADPCNIVGKLEGNPHELKHVREGDEVRVEAAG